MAGKSPPPAESRLAHTRDDRLKAALKANLARRKAQAKARSGETGKKNEESEG